MQPPSTRSLFGSALAAVSIIAAIGTWFGSRGAPRAADIGRDARAAPLSGPAWAPGRPTAPDASGARRLVPAVRAVAPAAPVAAHGRAIEPPTPGGLQVRVLLGATGESVPDAIVAWAEPIPALGPQRVEYWARGSDRAEWFAGASRWFQADADGVALLPEPARYAFLGAEHEGHFGTAQLWNSGGLALEPLDLRLWPAQSLKVRVVTAHERAPVAGADVAIRYRLDLEEEGSELLATKTTDAAGEVLFGDLRQYAEQYWPHTEELAVVLPGVFAEPVAVRFEPEDPPALIELAMPPTSEVEVHLRGADGAPFRSPAVVRAVPAGRADDEGAGTATVARDGVALLRQIGPDQSLEVRAWDAEQHQSGWTPVQSAPVAGERRIVELALGLGTPLVVAELATPAGVLAGAGVRLWFVDALGETGLENDLVAADGGGRVRFALPDAAKSGGTLTFTARIGERPWTARRELTVLAPGEHDLGRVLLEPEPPLVSGVVIGRADGAPVAGAVVTARIARSHAHGAVAARPPRSRSMDWVKACTAGDGSFVIAWPDARGDLTLSLKHRWYGLAEPLTVAAGTQALRIVADGRGSIAGSVRLREEWLADFTTIEALLKNETDHLVAVVQPPRTGQFAIEGLEAGSYALRFRLFGVEALAIDDLRVVAGVETRDERLRAVDLTGLHRVEVHLELGAGGEAYESSLWLRLPGREDWEEVDYEAGGAGRLGFYTSARGFDLGVLHPRHLAALATRVENRVELRLEPGVQVQFECSDPALVARAAELGLTLRAWIPSPLPYGYEVADFSIESIGSGRKLTLMSTGPATLRMAAYGRDASGAKTALATESQTIVIPFHGGRVEVALPAALFGSLPTGQPAAENDD